MVTGLGIALRPQIADDLLNNKNDPLKFIELNPEHHLNMGGYTRNLLTRLAEKYPILGHGLSLSLGSPDPLDIAFLKQLKKFIQETGMVLFSEHLSFSKCDNAHLDGLFPLPFRHEAINHVVERIKQTQDILGMQIAIENISYYTTLEPEMSEAEFIYEIIQRSDCKLLLDVSNVFVNGSNHNYEPKTFIKQLPIDKIAYIHLGGFSTNENELIDSHDQPLDEKVIDLFDWIVSQIKPVPITLERDSNYPDTLSELLDEISPLQSILDKHWKK